MITYTKLQNEGSSSLFIQFLECNRIIKFTNNRVFNVQVKFRFIYKMSLTCRTKCNEITLVSCVLIWFVVFNHIIAVFEYCTAFITFISSHSKYLLFFSLFFMNLVNNQLSQNRQKVFYDLEFTYNKIFWKGNLVFFSLHVHT